MLGARFKEPLTSSDKGSADAGMAAPEERGSWEPADTLLLQAKSMKNVLGILHRKLQALKTSEQATNEDLAHLKVRPPDTRSDR